MVRCPTCGRRVVDSGGACPIHSAISAPPSAAEQSAPFVVAAPALEGYRTERLLGQGGFGAVFRATRASDGGPVALKIARADQSSATLRLLREAEALRAIGAPHVPAVHASGLLSDGAGYVVMELVQAPTLAELLAGAARPMPVDRLSRVALSMVRIIELAHARGYVHCDLKPENVFVLEDGGAKLFDFGLVRRTTDPTVVETTTEEAPAGTPEYMSPEQCEGRLDIDARSDLYAIGVILYEMLAGAPPFWGNAAEVQQSHRSRRAPPLERIVSVAPELDQVVMRCLAKDRERRFATATELLQALELGLEAQRRAATPAPPPVASNEPGVPQARSGAANETSAALKTGAPVRERRAVALTFFESKSSVAAIREAMNAFGAQLAHTAGAQYVFAFGHEIGDNPTRAALMAAEMLVNRELTRRVLVDLASVSVQARPGGGYRYQSPLLTKKTQYPGESDPKGVMLSAAASEVLPEVPTDRVAERPGVLLVKKVEMASERTTTRMTVSPLVGRDDVLRSLLDGARAATGTGTPAIATLLGEPGYGKSHLTQVLVQHLQSIAPPIEVLFIRAKEVLGGAADQTIREILVRALGLPAAAPADLGRALLSDRLGTELGRDLWAGVAVSMGWAPPDHPELRAFSAAPGAIRGSSARAAGEALRKLSRRRPLALVIDDAQFVDETALDALEFAALKEARCPIWICVVARPGFGRGRTAWAGRAGQRHEVTLGPLDPTSAGELARRLLSPAENVPASALARLTERTQGIPMLLVELVRGLKRDGLVRRSEKTGAWFLATDELERMPDLPLFQWLASRETESLPGDLLAHARLAAMLGVEFTVEDFEGVVQELERAGVPVGSQLDAGVGIRRLTESGLLVRHRQSRVAFRHALLRETVYQAVAAAQRDAIHRAALQYYRARESMASDVRLPQMAFHAARSGIRDEAARIYLDLAERAMARHSYLDAETLYRNALDNLGDSELDALIKASRGRGLMRFRLGRYEESVADFEAARGRAQRASRTDAEIEILLDQATVLDFGNDWARSKTVVEEASGLARGELRTPMIEARILAGQGRSLFRGDQAAEACAQMERSIAIAETLGDEAYETLSMALNMMAWGLCVLGRFGDAERTFDRSLHVAEAHGDLLNVAAALHNRGLLSLVTGNIDRLLADHRRALGICREAGFTSIEGNVVRDLGEIYYLLGRTDESETYIHRAIDHFAQTMGERSRPVSVCELQLARLELYRGDMAMCRATLARVAARQDEALRGGEPDLELSPSDKVLFSCVEYALRGAAAAEWEELFARARQITALQPQDMIEMLETRGMSELRAGRHGEASRHLTEALEQARQHAQLMMDRLARELDQVRLLAAS